MNYEYKNKFAGKRVVCVASTPYQLMALVCIALEYTGVWACCDLLLTNQFTSSDVYADRLRKINLFNMVTVAEAAFNDSGHLGFDYLSELYFHKKRNVNAFCAAFPNLKNKRYDTLLCSCANMLSLDVKRICVPEGDTILFDDGSGTRTGHVLDPLGFFDTLAFRTSANSDTALRRVVRAISYALCPKTSRFAANGLLAFSPGGIPQEFYPGLVIGEIEFPKKLDTLSYVFSYDAQQIRRGRKVIFLSLPGGVPRKSLDNEMNFLEHVADYMDGDILIRLHPRRSRSDFSHYADKIMPDDLWELLYATGQLTEDDVLVALSSTAQATPKLLFDLEPKVIFGYRLYDLPGLAVDSFFLLQSDLERSYRNQSLICSPSSMEELSDALKN